MQEVADLCATLVQKMAMGKDALRYQLLPTETLDEELSQLRLHHEVDRRILMGQTEEEVVPFQEVKLMVKLMIRYYGSTHELLLFCILKAMLNPFPWISIN